MPSKHKTIAAMLVALLAVGAVALQQVAPGMASANAQAERHDDNDGTSFPANAYREDNDDGAAESCTNPGQQRSQRVADQGRIRARESHGE